MKFYGKSNMLVTDSRKDNKPLFRFDKNGEFVTEDERLIKRLKQHFKYEDNAKSDSINCKKCDFSCSNRGELMAHYKKEHPKEG
jgi:hypothetical protein